MEAEKPIEALRFSVRVFKNEPAIPMGSPNDLKNAFDSLAVDCRLRELLSVSAIPLCGVPANPMDAARVIVNILFPEYPAEEPNEPIMVFA